MKKYRYIYCLVGVLCMGFLLSSCKVGRSYSRPEMALPDSLYFKKDSLSLADFEWWQVYTDPQLVALIDQALTYNKDVLIAAARVKEFAALKRINTANLLPQFNLDISAETKSQKDDGKRTSKETYKAYAELSWELDLWGKLRWSRESGIAEFLSTLEAQRALQLTIISEVASSYYELIALDAEMHILSQTLEDRKANIRLARIRFEGGLTSEIPYQQAQVEMARTATMIPEQELAIKIKENELAFLIGSFPKEIRRTETLSSLFNMDDLPYGLPSQLLQRRPDICQAEQSLIAAHAKVGVAYTSMFPSLSLTAEFGANKSGLSSFLRAPYSLIEGALAGPLFNMGKNRAAWKAKKAAFEQSLYDYEKTVLNAFMETQNAILDYDKLREVHKLKAHLERAAQKYVEFAHLQYINGSIGYLDVLDAQRGYLDAQIGLNNAIRDELLAVIQLYKSLGGGWNLTSQTKIPD